MIRRIKFFSFYHFSRSLKVYKLKELEKVLESKGFTFHHQHATHRIYANDKREFITIPIGKKGEVNAMMSTVALQRIEHNQCAKMDIITFGKYVRN